VTNKQVEFFRIASAMARAQADMVNALQAKRRAEADYRDASERYTAAKDAHDSAMIELHTSTPIDAKGDKCE